MVWPQVSLAQMAALLVPDYSVEIVDAIAMRMGWPEFEAILRDRRPRYYLTQVTAPTLTNDLYGVFLARSLGGATMAFGASRRWRARRRRLPPRLRAARRPELRASCSTPRRGARSLAGGTMLTGRGDRRPPSATAHVAL
jgi:hypothetical protein